MIRSIFFVLTVFLSFSLRAQTVITQWNFNGASAATVPGGVLTPSPSTGSGSLQLIGGVTATFGSGLSSTDPVSTSPPNYSWQTAGYPAPGTGEKTAGIIIVAPTTGFNSLSLVFDQRLSNTSDDTWLVYYTNDVTAGSPVWVQQTIFTFTPDPTTTGDRWYNQRTVDFSAITSLNDNAKAGFKIVSAFDPVAGNYLAARSTSTYATTGNSRFDMVTISGLPIIIVQNNAPVVSSSSISGKLNEGDSLIAAYAYTDTEGDLEGASIYKWFRADDASGTNETQIAGADTLVYIPVAADLNKFILFEVTPVAQTGTSPGTPLRTTYMGPVQESLEILLYPSPFDLSTGNYSLQSWAAASSPATFPLNMVFQQFDNEPDSRIDKPDALWRCTYNGTSRSRMLGLESEGIGFINTSDVQDTPALCGNGTNSGGYVGAAVLAINTTGLTNITLKWESSLKIQGSGTPAREYRLVPQYKIAGSATWTDFGPAYEFTSSNAVVDQSMSYSVTLPVALENVPDALIRWIYYQVQSGASGSRPEIRLDEISVSIPGAPDSAPVASGLTVKGLQLVAQPLTAFYVYSDAEGDLQGQSVIKWYRASDQSGTGATLITGASALTYTTGAADVGKYIGFQVTPVALTGTLTGSASTSVYVGPILDLAEPSVIKINEVYSRGDATNTNADLKADWVEFYNPGTKDVTLAGLVLCDDSQCVTLPASAGVTLTITAGGFVALSQNDVNSFTFGLSSLGEYVVLKRPDNHVIIDSLNFPALEVTQTFGRYTDGTPRVTTLTPPTKGASNDTATPGDITGLAYSNKELTTQLYPVPTSGILNVVTSGQTSIQSVSVFNITGQEVCNNTATGSSVCITLPEMKPGFYLVKIAYQDGSIEMRKIVRE